MSFRTVQAVSRMYFLCIFCSVWSRLVYLAVSADDEYHLAAVVMRVYTYGCTRDKAAFEYAVCAVEEHVCGKLLLSAFEFREM